MNPIAIRLLSQQLICQQFTSPAELVAHMGAMQAQDYRMVRWAVEMRIKKPSIQEFRESFNAGEIIRLHLLRGTWQLVAVEDFWWMLDLCAPYAKRMLNGWMKANNVTIDDNELHLIRQILIRVAEDKGNVTKDDFAEALSAKGIFMDSHRLTYHIRLAELDGVLCSGNLSPMRSTFALAEKKVRRTSSMERDEMLMLLTRKYFQSHSPATFDDFVWWTGMNVADCRRGIGLLSAELHQETWHGYTFYLHDSSRTKGFRKGATLLLPPFDEYLIGYKSRELAIAPDHTPRAYNKNWNLLPGNGPRWHHLRQLGTVEKATANPLL